MSYNVLTSNILSDVMMGHLQHHQMLRHSGPWLVNIQLGDYFGPGDCSGKARTSLNDRTKRCAFHVVDDEARNERKRNRNTRVWAFRGFRRTLRERERERASQTQQP